MLKRAWRGATTSSWKSSLNVVKRFEFSLLELNLKLSLELEWDLLIPIILSELWSIYKKWNSDLSPIPWNWKITSLYFVIHPNLNEDTKSELQVSKIKVKMNILFHCLLPLLLMYSRDHYCRHISATIVSETQHCATDKAINFWWLPSPAFVNHHCW